MKTLLASLLLAATIPMIAAEQTFTTTVSGNCGSCKKRIVKAAEGVDGVLRASWDKKTKVFTATFDDAKTTRQAVVQAIVAVGHDADTLKASTSTYDSLPDCCAYRSNKTTH